MRLASVWIWASVLCGWVSVDLHAAQSELVVPERGVLRVETSGKIRPGKYQRGPEPAAPGEPACVVRLAGVDNVVLDLRDVVLRGAAPTVALDQLTGYGIYLTDCRGVVLRGGTLSGFKGAVVAERCDGLRIENVRIDGNFAQRLSSTSMADDDGDQLDRRANQQGGWLANYGAGISLSDCSSPVISGCRVRHGQNGLLLTRGSNARIFDNDFSFLSGWGIALYRSSGNLITRNRCDYNVRGFVDERYAVGHGAGAILLIERSSNNLIAENSAVRCSVGLVIDGGEEYAGELSSSSAESELGGSDRNIVHGNHFSFAVTYGIEMSFTRDCRLIENVASDCAKAGIQGEFNRGSVIARNDLRGAGGAGLSMKNSQEGLIVGNLLERCATGLELFQDDDPRFVQEARAQNEAISSRDHWVFDNSFAENDFDIAIDRTRGLTFAQNIIAIDNGDPTIAELTFADGEEPGELAPKAALRGVLGRLPSGRVRASTVRRPPSELPEELAARLTIEGPSLPGSTRPFDPSRAHATGREDVFLGEWGPWDFESREPKPAPRPFGGALAAATWRARWFNWSDGPDPRGDATVQAQWRALADDAPVELDIGVWTDPWADSRDVRLAVGENRFGLLASTRIDLPAGRYRLRILSDDGVRARIDDVVRIEDWSWHTERHSEAVFELQAGAHTFDLEYFQIDGAAALSIDLLML